MATLIRTDRNGTKYYEGEQPCPRCDGKGIYYIGVNNGRLVPSWVDQGVCFQCMGKGTVTEKWKEYTPEYEQKLAERRAKRQAKYLADHAEEIAQAEAERQARIEKEQAERKAREEEEARLEAERKAKEQAEQERKANSNYVGSIGDKIDATLIYNYSAHFEIPSFAGFGTTLMFIHNFSDDAGNTYIWKTDRGISIKDVKEDKWFYPEQGDKIIVKGTIKEHSEYKGEKQTVLTRCKIKMVMEE